MSNDIFSYFSYFQYILYNTICWFFKLSCQNYFTKAATGAGKLFPGEWFSSAPASDFASGTDNLVDPKNTQYSK